eukprot:4691605-Karenia_brevis.AAC.1
MAVKVEFLIQEVRAQATGEVRKPVINIAKTSCPVAAGAFSSMMWHAPRHSSASLNDHLAALNDFTFRAAVACFGVLKDTPRKPWI